MGDPATRTRRTLRRQLGRWLAVISLAPFLALAVGIGWVRLRQLRETETQRYRTVASETAAALDAYLEQHQRAVESTAFAVSQVWPQPKDALERYLRETRRLYPGLLTLIVADESARKIAGEPPANFDGTSFVGQSVADREYFQQPMTTGKPYLSGVFQGRGFGNDVIVAVSAAVAHGGRRLGVVEASLDLKRLATLVASAGAAPSAAVVILDRNHTVAWADTATGLQPLDRLQPASAATAGLDDGRHLYFEAIAPLASWRVVVRAEERALETERITFLLFSLAVLLLSALLYVGTAFYAARRMAAPLELLTTALRQIDLEKPGSGAMPRVDRHAPTEVAQLVSDFQRMLERAHTSYSDLQRVLRSRQATQRQLETLLTELETRVEERTAELRASRDRAEAATRLKDQFVGSVSHELRTPLAGILGLTRLLLDQARDAPQRELIERLLQSGTTLQTLVDDLLDFAKMESGRIDLVAAAFEPRRLFAELRAATAGAAQAKGLALHIRVDDNVPDFLVGDAIRLGQILSNLADNAVKFTRSGSVSVEARRASADDEPVRIEFRVRDTGTGIAIEDQRRIFAAFTQVDASMARRHEGAGLGLSIAERLTQSMGGHIGIESSSAAGTTFLVRLPFASAAPGVPASASVSTAGSGLDAIAGRLQDLRILVVDDDAVGRLIAGKFLERAGATVELAGDGYQALAATESTHFDAILMDLQMPGMDGFETARRLQDGRHNGTPIVALTANAMAEDVARCLAAGMAAHVAKPMEPLDLCVRILEVVAARRPAAGQ
jgi:two-component system, sensor histidine kinase